MSPFELSIRFFLQLAVILAVCRLVGWLAARAGQPQVVGEMIAGVVLGPSVFGVLAPEAQAAIFPPESRSILFCASQVGLAIYMFLVGVEFDARRIRARARSALAVSASGILAPLVLGAGAAALLMDSWPLFPPEVGRLEAMLFLGAAMAITAFPMLARIIHERGLAGTPVGTLALGAGSVDDAAAWCVLAVVLAVFSGQTAMALLAIGGGLFYVALVVIFAVPLFRWLEHRTAARGELTRPALSGVLGLVMLGSWFTDIIGIYAVFGAFALGVAVPKGELARHLQIHAEKFTAGFLLPLFFVYSGLNTKIALLDSLPLWGVAALLTLVAILAKGVACFMAARLCGEAPRDAFRIGALMNARGLMELIILNIGLERGIITPTLFTMMVLMAIVTTLMAVPLFRLAGPLGGGDPKDTA